MIGNGKEISAIHKSKSNVYIELQSLYLTENHIQYMRFNYKKRIYTQITTYLSTEDKQIKILNQNKTSWKTYKESS